MADWPVLNPIHVLLTGATGVASWLFVERPALRLKTRGPGRRLAQSRSARSTDELLDDGGGVGQQFDLILEGGGGGGVAGVVENPPAGVADRVG
jgi:hypothetical protein